jgi:hypothetical protein
MKSCKASTSWFAELQKVLGKAKAKAKEIYFAIIHTLSSHPAKPWRSRTLSGKPFAIGHKHTVFKK